MIDHYLISLVKTYLKSNIFIVKKPLLNVKNYLNENECWKNRQAHQAPPGIAWNSAIHLQCDYRHCRHCCSGHRSRPDPDSID